MTMSVWLNEEQDSGSAIEDLNRNKLYASFILALEKSLERHGPDQKLPSKDHIRTLMSMSITEKLEKIPVRPNKVPSRVELSVAKRSLAILDSIRSFAGKGDLEFALNLRKSIAQPLQSNLSTTKKLRTRRQKKPTKSMDQILGDLTDDDEEDSENNSELNNSPSKKRSTTGADSALDELDDLLQDSFFSMSMSDGDLDSNADIQLPDIWQSTESIWKMLEWSFSLSSSGNPKYARRWLSSLKPFLEFYISLLEMDYGYGDLEAYQPIICYLLSRDTVAALRAVLEVPDEEGNPKCEPFSGETVSKGKYAVCFSDGSLDLRSRFLDLIFLAYKNSPQNCDERELYDEYMNRLSVFRLNASKLSECHQSPNTIWRLIWLQSLQTYIDFNGMELFAHFSSLRPSPSLVIYSICETYITDPKSKTQSTIWDINCILKLFLEALIQVDSNNEMDKADHKRVIQHWNDGGLAKNWISGLQIDQKDQQEFNYLVKSISIAIKQAK